MKRIQMCMPCVKYPMNLHRFFFLFWCIFSVFLLQFAFQFITFKGIFTICWFGIGINVNNQYKVGGRRLKNFFRVFFSLFFRMGNKTPIAECAQLWALIWIICGNISAWQKKIVKLWLLLRLSTNKGKWKCLKKNEYQL